MKLFKKLKSRKGETLVGILVAILIIALSASLFAAMYSASMNINLSARKQDELVNQAVTNLENNTGEPTGTGILTYKIDDGQPRSVEVNIYSENGLTAYSETEGTQ